MLGFEDLIVLIQTKEPVIYNDPYAGKTQYDYIDEIKITDNRITDGGKMSLKANMVKETEQGIRMCSCEGYAKYIERVKK